MSYSPGQPRYLQQTHYDQKKQQLQEAIQNYTVVPVTTNPGDGGPGNLWHNTTNHHFYNGPTDLQAGGGGGGTSIEVNDLGNVTLNDSTGANPITCGMRLMREILPGGRYIVWFDIDQCTGIKTVTQYYEGVGVIPAAYRSDKSAESILTFHPTTLVGQYNSDVLSFVEVNHTTGTIRFWKEGLPGTGVWTGIWSGWLGLSMRWSSAGDP